jgi:anti-sigma factor RsiW
MGRCREMVEFLSDYMDNELEAGVREKFEKHLSGCEPCRRFLASTRKTVHLYGRLQYDAIPSELKERMRSFFASRPMKPEP